MKNIYIIVILSFMSIYTFAQKIDYNIQDGYIAEGFDVVEYFNNDAIKGKQQFVVSYNDAKYKFSTKENLNTFKLNSKKYAPQYGGWCAYAMGDKGEKVSVNPKTFEIRNDKLYLFYDAYFTNTLDRWLEEGPEELRKKADKNWNRVKNLK